MPNSMVDVIETVSLDGVQNKRSGAVLKDFLKLFLPVLVIASMAAMAFLYVGQQNRDQLFQARTAHHVELAARTIELTFNSIIADLRYLSELKELDALIEMPSSSENRSALSDNFLSFSKNKGVYDQIRYLDAEGKEQVRINFNANQPYAVPKEKLQNKGKRYYFYDTFSLNRADVFVSPLDLNIERGKVEIPRKPMLRFGTPVYDKQGNKNGIVLLNYLGTHLLELFKQSVEGFPGSMYLLNSDGYWLASPQSEDEWGFMYPERHDRVMKKRAPAVWSRVSAKKSGNIQEEGGIYTFATTYPLLENLRSSSGTGDEAFEPSQQQAGHEDYYWKIVAFTPTSLRETLSWTENLRFGFFYLLVLTLGAVGSWLLAHSRKRVQDGVVALNHKVDELQNTRQELVQSEKMASLGRMVAGFAHEVNTPVGVAVAASSQISSANDELSEILNQEQVKEEELRDRLEVIDSSSKLALSNLRRASTLIQSFRRTSVDQASEMSRTFLFNELIQDVINSLHNSFKNRGIQFEVVCPEKLSLNGQPGIYTQILTNLMMNSATHAFNGDEKSGKIRVEVEIQDEKQLHLTYSDTGRGMDETTRAEIFEPFFTTNRGEGNTGLGLYVCYNLITSELNGEIVCNSTPGNGATFLIKNPIITCE